MTDYATLTDAEINRRIAEALGYRTEKIAERDVFIFKGIRLEWRLVTPHELRDNSEQASASEVLAWERTPMWSTNVANALELLDQCPEYIIWKDTYKDKQGDVEIHYRLQIGETMRPSRYDMSLPRAICEAWLAWKEETHE